MSGRWTSREDFAAWLAEHRWLASGPACGDLVRRKLEAAGLRTSMLTS